MGTYSITELEKLSGIKAHTIRIWEKRYDLLKTKRTPTNIRYYDDEDLRRIINIAFLVKNGVKISKAAKLSATDITKQVEELSKKESSFRYEIDQFILSMVDFNEAKFEKIISSCIIKYGIENTMIKVMYPFLDRVGIMWQTGSINPAQEHFMSNLIRQKLLLAIDGAEIGNAAQTKFLLFLPEGELHEIALLFTNYLIRVRGYHTLYLGQTVPFKDVKAAYDFYRPDFLFTSITNSLKDQHLKDYLKLLSETFKQSTILLSGNALNTIDTKKLPANSVYLKSVQETISYLNK